MATSLRALRLASKAVFCSIRRETLPFSKRNLLSSAYSCTELWNKSFDSSTFGELSLSEFAVQIHEQLEKSGRISAVDMNVFAHQFGQLEGDEEEAEFVEDILRRYNLCQDSFPPCPSTCHALVRNYITAGLANRLPPLLSDRLTFGLFPNHYTLNLLMDHFINNKDFTNAVTLAYWSTLQEDFSDPVNSLLSIYACTQFLASIDSIGELVPPPKEESDGEEEWIKVKYIRFPHYDDHFDIKDQRFLLGKTMIALSEVQCVKIPDDIHVNLKVIGAGLYQKFDKGIAFLSELLQSSDRSVSSQALNYFSESLQKVESRDPDEPEVEIGLRTIDDEIRKLLPSQEEKENFISEFERLKEQLVSSGKVVENFNLNQSVAEFVTTTISSYEQSNIDGQSTLFMSWREKREKELEHQLFELRKGERMEEMKKQIRELQEEEELLEYFQKEENVRLTFLPEDSEKSNPELSITKI